MGEWIGMNSSNDQTLVTFALFSYNQEKFIRDAVEGALSQNYSPLQIILSDDCSSDNTFQIMQSMVESYAGSCEIILNRNEQNLGLCAHVNRVMSMAKGEIIVIAAGDDVSLPDRVAKSVDVFRKNPSATVVGFSDIVIDDDSKIIRVPDENKENLIISLNDYLTGKSPHLSGASRSLNRNVIDMFEPLNEACPAEDVPFLLRALMIGHGVISADTGIKYRQHGNNLSSAKSIHAMNFLELRNQYQKDFDMACSKGMIKQDIARRFELWIERNYKRCVFFSELYYSKRKIICFITKGILNKHLNPREKLIIVKRLLDPRRAFVFDS